MSKSPSLRRIQADIRELALDPSPQYFAAPLESDMFEWHFTIRGAEGTDFEGGIYHGRILLPAEYPYKPPHIVFLTPSGRFETNTKVCLSFSAYHPELWQPAWGIRLILEALISFLPTPGDGAIGALDYKPEERKRLAKLSRSWCCPTCGPIAKLLPKVDPETKNTCSKTGGKSSGVFSKQIAELQRLQQQSEGARQKRTNVTKTSGTHIKVAGDGDATTKTTSAAAITTTCVEEKKVEANINPSRQNDKKAAATATTEESDARVVINTQTNPLTMDERETNNKAAAAVVEEEKRPARQLEQPSNKNVEETANANAAATESTTDEATAVVGVTPVDNLSKLYDPLMNISILLMICICVLLWRKGVDLSQELHQLKTAAPEEL